MTNRKGKNEPAVPDVSKMSNEELLDAFEGSTGYENWAISSSEFDYHEGVLLAARPEILKRMKDNRS